MIDVDTTERERPKPERGPRVEPPLKVRAFGFWTGALRTTLAVVTVWCLVALVVSDDAAMKPTLGVCFVVGLAGLTVAAACDRR